MPSARRLAEGSAASSTSSSMRSPRNGPSSGELNASRRSGGPSPPMCFVSEGGNSTITVVTLAEGVIGYRHPYRVRQARGHPQAAGGVNGSAGGAKGSAGGGGANSGGGGGAISGAGANGASCAIITTGASGAGGGTISGGGGANGIPASGAGIA